MNEKPILFNTEMVKAILKGRKTSTRRITKFKPYTSINETNGDFEICEPVTQNFFRCRVDFEKWAIKKCKYKVGDILYIRETWSQEYKGKEDEKGNGILEYVYRADGSLLDKPEGYCNKWRPSIHMPKAAARIFLKVTDVRVEKLKNITEEGAKAEGALRQMWYQPYGTRTEGSQKYVGDITHQEPNYITGFAGIWDRTLQKPDSWLYKFQENPWVWVIEFERVNHKEIGGN